MERLPYPEIRLVIDALAKRRDTLQAKLDRADEDDQSADDLLLYESLIKFFKNEAKDEMTRSENEVSKKFDLDKIREQTGKK